MGKYALLITFAGVLGLSYLAQQSQSTSLDTSEDQAERQRTVIARQIARSAFNNGVSAVKRNWPTVPSDEQGAYEQGDYRLNFSSPSTGEEGEEDEDDGSDEDKKINIASTGIFPQTGSPDEVRYLIEGVAEQKKVASGLFSGLTAGGVISFTGSSGKGCSGAACISGLTPNGENRRGMSLPGEMGEGKSDDWCPGGFGPGQILGSGGKGGSDCDVQVRDKASDDWVKEKMSEMKSRITSNKDKPEVTVCGEGNPGGGSGDNPGEGGESNPGEGSDENPGKGNNKSFGGSFVVDLAGGPPGGPRVRGSGTLQETGAEGSSKGGPPGTCRFNGNKGGSGILYVPPGESLRFNGGATWDGLVYVADGGQVRINGGGGKTNINGGLLMEKGATFKMNGGNRVQYNPAELLKYVDLLPSIETTEVTITDRRSKVVQ